MRDTRLVHLTRGALAAAALALPALVTPVTVDAQAFGLLEIGTCAVGRTGAGVGAPCEDASRVFWNPGAAMRLPHEVSLMAGAAAIQLGGGFTQDTTGRFYEADSPLEAVPHLFANYRVQRRFALGFGVYVPYGLTSQWMDDFPGRFQAKRASLASIYVQPNFAFDVLPGRLAIGGGPVIGISEVELIQALDLSTVPTGSTLNGQPVRFGQLGIAPGTEFGRAELHGADVEWGYNLGIHWQVANSLSIGARYLSELDFKYSASAEFTQTNTGLVFGGAIPGAIPAGTSVDDLLRPQFTAGRLTERTVRTRIRHPAQAQIGLGFTGLARTTVNLDYAWVDWSVFEELPVDFSPEGGDANGLDRVLYEDYEDSWSVKGSVDHVLGNGWTARAGAGYVSTPAPDVTVTPLLPDQDRYNFAVGLSVPFGSRYVLDAGYWRVETPGRRGRILERESRTQTAAQLNGGWYELNANVFSVSLKANW